MTNLIIVIIAIVAIIVILLWIPNCISSRMVGICWLSDRFRARPQETNPLCPANRKYPWQAACDPGRRHWNYSFPVAKALWRLRRFHWPSKEPWNRLPDVVRQLVGTGMVPWYLLVIRAQDTNLSHLLLLNVDHCDYCDYCLDHFDYCSEYSDYCFWIIQIIVFRLLKCFLNSFFVPFRWIIAIIAIIALIQLIAIILNRRDYFKLSISIISIIAKHAVILIIHIIHIIWYRREPIGCASIQSWKKSSFFAQTCSVGDLE